MWKHAPAILVLFALTAWFVYLAVQHSSGTVGDKIYGLTNMAVAVFVAIISLVAAVVAAFTRRKVFRNYLLTISVLAVGIAPVSFAAENYRKGSTVTYLEVVYESLSKKGQPFPIQIQHPGHGVFSHGYWVSDDLKTFEVYYHDGSDSYTLAYPAGEWEWRSNQYAGPE